MGQKVNPNILRLGKVTEWNSKYIEKKTTELSVKLFRDLEIQKFIYQLFMKSGLKIQNFKIYYSEGSLNIYISYYNSTKPLRKNSKLKPQQTKIISKPFKKKITNIEKSITKQQLYFIKTYKKVFSKSLKKMSFRNEYLLNAKTQRLTTIKNYQTYKSAKNYKTLNFSNKNLFILKILKSLNLFTKKKHNVVLHLKQINKETIFLQKAIKTDKYKMKNNIIQLRRFQQNEFFEKGFDLLYNFATNKQSSLFLAEFIAMFLKKLKRPNFFLRFLKLALKTLLAKKSYPYDRVQIKIKGRFNGAPRSTHKFINVGKNIPVLTLNSKIDYGESTAYTSNGTFGVKVWTYTPTYNNSLFPQ